MPDKEHPLTAIRDRLEEEIKAVKPYDQRVDRAIESLIAETARAITAFRTTLDDVDRELSEELAARPDDLAKHLVPIGVKRKVKFAQHVTRDFTSQKFSKVADALGTPGVPELQELLDIKPGEVRGILDNPRTAREVDLGIIQLYSFTAALVEFGCSEDTLVAINQLRRNRHLNNTHLVELALLGISTDKLRLVKDAALRNYMRNFFVMLASTTSKEDAVLKKLGKTAATALLNVAAHPSQSDPDSNVDLPAALSDLSSSKERLEMFRMLHSASRNVQLASIGLSRGWTREEGKLAAAAVDFLGPENASGIGAISRIIETIHDHEESLSPDELRKRLAMGRAAGVPATGLAPYIMEHDMFKPTAEAYATMRMLDPRQTNQRYHFGRASVYAADWMLLALSEEELKTVVEELGSAASHNDVLREMQLRATGEAEAGGYRPPSQTRHHYDSVRGALLDRLLNDRKELMK